MGWTARKSFKIMPGVRMTVSPRGVSTSVGVRGMRVTRTATGRVTRTVGIPGTGVRNTTTISSPDRRTTARANNSRTQSHPSPEQAAPAAAPKPGLFAPKWEKDLYTAVSKEKWDELESIARTYPDAAPVASVLDGLTHLEQADLPRTVGVLRWAWQNAGEIENVEFVRKYISSSTVSVTIAEGMQVTLPISRDAVGLALAETEQVLGNIEAAIEVVESMDPSAIAAVSLCELYIEAGRYDDVIDVTNGITNDDDPTALLVTFRGIAFRERELLSASLESFKEALKSSKREPAIRHRALVERAGTYLLSGKKAQARKDLEKVLAEDSNYEGVRGLLSSL